MAVDLGLFKSRKKRDKPRELRVYSRHGWLKWNPLLFKEKDNSLKFPIEGIPYFKNFDFIVILLMLAKQVSKWVTSTKHVPHLMVECKKYPNGILLVNDSPYITQGKQIK